MSLKLSAFFALVLAALIAGAASSGDQRPLRQKRQAGLCPESAARADARIEPRIIHFNARTRKDVEIELADRTNYRWDSRDVVGMVRSGFNLSQPTLLYSHGYTQDGWALWLSGMRQRYRDLIASRSEAPPAFNLMFYDWSAESRKLYGHSASLVPNLGRALGEFFLQLAKTYNYDTSRVHLVGYSLSTHIVGQAGRHLRANGMSLSQITAIDPTGVCFHDNSLFANAHMLRPSDASLVVARHYDMFDFGARRAIGGIDIFVNGGRHQTVASREAARLFKRDLERVSPEDDGELLVGSPLSHLKAVVHESHKPQDDCHEVAYQCESYRQFEAGACGLCGRDGSQCYYLDNYDFVQKNESERLNLRATNYRRGTSMYIKTSVGESCLQHYQVVANFRKRPARLTSVALESGELRFGLTKLQDSRPRNRASDTKYTELLTRERRLRLRKKVKVRSRSTSLLKSLATSLESLEVKYMSHPIGVERQRLSARFCPTSTTAEDATLVKC